MSRVQRHPKDVTEQRFRKMQKVHEELIAKDFIKHLRLFDRTTRDLVHIARSSRKAKEERLRHSPPPNLQGLAPFPVPEDPPAGLS